MIALRRILAALFAGLIVLAALGAGRVQAHEVRPALIEITERAAGTCDILWKRPVVGDYAVRLVPDLEGGKLDRPADEVETASSYQISIWRNVPVAPTLDGSSIKVHGLERTITDVLVMVEQADGSRFQTILTPAAPQAVIRIGKPGGLAVPAYFRLGVLHILTGYDHLAFVLGLILLVGNRSMLIRTVTAFTLAHSITLALTALKLIEVRPALIEALVALSILFVAVEVVHLYRGRPTLMAGHPWVIAFGFGLLHGCAFAGAISTIGLPQAAVLPALLLFNLGVEAGQLSFIAAVLAIMKARNRLRVKLPRWSRWLAPYAIGSLSAFWFVTQVRVAFADA